MKVYLTRRYLFCASHRLHSPALSDEANREVYGKCSHPYGHGHNYFLEVTLSGPIAPETGMLCDLGELDAPVARVCSAEVPIPYAAHLEEAALPQAATIAVAARKAVG